MMALELFVNAAMHSGCSSESDSGGVSPSMEAAGSAAEVFFRKLAYENRAFATLFFWKAYSIYRLRTPLTANDPD
jgi:hypothetical protein